MTLLATQPFMGVAAGGGGGLHFRNPVDVFADAAARTAAFDTGGTLAGEHEQFVTDRTLAIVIGTIANPTSFQTYTGDTGTYDDTAWLNRTDAVQGRPGSAGSNGAPGGGAWASIGSDAETGNRASNVFYATGITMPANRDVFGYRLTGTAANLQLQGAIAIGSMALLESKNAASAGDTSTTDSRITIPEWPGTQGSISGNVYAGMTVARELLLATSGTNTFVAIEVFDYVPSAVQGGRTDAEIQALINATNLSALQGAVTDAQIPAAIMRDAEFTSAAIIALITGNIAFSDLAGMIADGQVPASFMRDAELTLVAVANVLGITTAQAGDILIGAPTLSGQELTFTDADGNTTTITLPAGMGTGTADGRLRFGTTAPDAALGIDGDSYVLVDTTANTAAFYEKASGAWTLEFTVDLAQVVGTHTRYAAASPDATFTEAEWLAGNTSMAGQITFPVTTVAHHKGFAIPATEASLTVIRQVGNPFNGRASYSPAVGADDVLQDIDGVSHKTYIKGTQDFAGAETEYELS